MSAIYKPDFEKFFLADDIRSSLEQWRSQYPELIRTEVLGETHQGRPVWLAEISDRSKGSIDEKPGMYIEASIHAEEVMTTSVAMHIIWTLLDAFSSDKSVAQLLEEYVFYIIPRVNPDGPEFCLTQGFPWVGNGRYLPGEDQPEKGFFYKDIDGNGIIAQIRMEDPHGEWKICGENPRVMELRKPYENEGTFYRLFPEGMINDFDGVELAYPKPRDGNLNRNFPANFLPEGMQYGAGEYPFSEPETACVRKVFEEHKNIAMVLSFHTNAGVILRPFADKGDDAYVGQDLTLYKFLGKIGTEDTGYPVCSVYEDFTPDKKGAVRGGTLTDWTYEQQGIPSMVVELWDVYKEAGIEMEGFYASDERSGAEESQLLAFMEEKHEKNAYLDWKPFDHPQLGKVEIGGWNRIWVFRNAPPRMVPDIAEYNTKFSLHLAATMPKIYVDTVVTEALGDDHLRISVAVGNSGYLSTNLTDLATAIKASTPIKVELVGEDDAYEIVSGKKVVTIDSLSGRIERRQPWSQWIPLWGPDRKKVEWIIRKKRENVSLSVNAACEKAGAASVAIQLD